VTDDLERRLRETLRAVDHAAGEPRRPERPPDARSGAARLAPSRPTARALVAAVLAALLAAGVAVVARRGDDDQRVVADEPNALYEGVGLFVARGERAELCAQGTVDLIEGLPCTGTVVEVTGLDGSDLAGDHAYVRFTGRLSSDGLAIESRELVEAPATPVLRRRDPGAPCASSRPATGVPSGEQLADGLDAIRARDGFGGAWIERPGPRGGEIALEPTGRVDDATLVVAGARDLSGLADAAAQLWRGPICALTVPFTMDELEAVQIATAAFECEGLFRDCVIASSIDEPGNRVVVETLAPSDRLEQAFDEALLAGSMELVELLRPVR